MVGARVLSLGVELALAGAAGAAFAGLLMGGPAGARWSRAVTVAAGAVGLLVAVTTLRADETWLFDAVRISTFSQAAKAVICALLLLPILRPHAGDAFARARTVDPFFRLVAALAVALAVSAGDLLVLWLALELGSLALVAAFASAGSSQEQAVHRLVRAWLPASMVTMLGTIILAAAAGGTKVEDLQSLVDVRGITAATALGAGLVVLATLARALPFARALLVFRTTSSGRI